MQAAYETEITRSVSDLFRTMLNTEVVPTEEHIPHAQDMVAAAITFTGTWKGGLLLECRRAQALCFAARFLQSDDIEEFSEDVTSTIEELSNIIAGNLKEALPGGVRVGIPSLVNSQDHPGRTCVGKVINHTVFTTDAGLFSVWLIEGASFSGEET